MDDLLSARVVGGHYHFPFALERFVKDRPNELIRQKTREMRITSSRGTRRRRRLPWDCSHEHARGLPSSVTFASMFVLFIRAFPI